MCAWRIVISQAKQGMSQCYIPSLHAIHFKGALNSGEAQDNQENPAVVEAVMRHSKMDMTLYYSHSHRAAKRAAQERVLQRVVPAEMRVQMRELRSIQ